MFSEGAFLDSMTEFTVDARSVTRNGEGKVKVVVTSPSGIRTEALVSNKHDGTYTVDYSVFEEGKKAKTKIDKRQHAYYAFS